jgi:CBS domain-containing protein
MTSNRAVAEGSAVLAERTVLEVMTRRVHIANANTPITLLTRLIKENGVGAIPIVDQLGIPIGIVSELNVLVHELRSLRDVMDSGTAPPGRPKAGGIASEIMTSPPNTVRSDASLNDAERVMNERGVRRLIVVDDGGRIAGILTRGDLA